MQAVMLKHQNGQIGVEIPFKYCTMSNHFGEEELWFTEWGNCFAVQEDWLGGH